MRARLMRGLGVLNVLLAIGLVAMAVWLYAREHAVRRLERQIHKLEQARQLEEEGIRRLAIEWQTLRNPMRLEELARLRLELVPPDPAAVQPFMTLMENLPMRPQPAADAAAERDALAAMALRAASEAARATVHAPVPRNGRVTPDGVRPMPNQKRDAILEAWP